MTLAQVIAWVRDQVNNLINRIRGVAQDISSGLADIRDWARTEIRDILDRAESFAQNLVDRVKAWFSNLVDGVKHGLQTFIERVRAYALELYNIAIARINEKIAWVNGVIQAVKETLQAWVISFVNGLIAAVRSWAQSQLNHILDWVKELQNYLPLLKSLTTLLTAANFNRLRDFLSRMYGMLFFLVDNPLVFIYSYIRATFTQFLCYALAYGLGSVQTALPPWPVWGTGTVLPPEIYEPPEIYTPSGLVSPLASLWISGYIYGSTHHAIDLGAIGGEPVFAMHDGIITESGWSNVGYGNQVVVSGSPWWSRYAHFMDVTVMVGQEVEAGDVIGHANSTGQSTGNHLHLEIKHGGQWVDPVTVLPIGG